MLIGMALGVAVVFAVDITNESAKRGFSLSLDAVTGQSTHQMSGGAGGLDEKIYTRLRTELGIRQSAPVVDGSVSLLSTDGQSVETVRLLGVDLFAEPMFRDQSSNTSGTQGARSSLALLGTGAIILGDSTAARLGIVIGDQVRLADAGTLHQLQLINTIDTSQQAAFDTIAMADISTAQELLSLQGRLSRIDLIIPDDQTDATVRLLKSEFPRVQVIGAERSNNALQQMTQAFHTNLLAMSLLALLVGAFLIYNTVTLSVLQRRPLFGQLRVSGVQRSELFRAILFETLVFATIGTIAGLLLGLLLGNMLLTLVTRTINDLYFALDVRRLDFSLFTLLKSIGIGVGAALLAALPPAIEAAQSPPVTVIQRSSVERRATGMVPLLALLGVVLSALGWFILWASQDSLWAAFTALFSIVIGFSLLIPVVLVLLATVFGWLLGRMPVSGALGQYPLRSITASLSRTSVAIAALVVAVSATAGVGIMISSFRLSVSDWLGNTLQSDFYVRNASSPGKALPLELVEKISGMDSFSGVRRARSADIDTSLTPARLLAIQNNGQSNPGYTFKSAANQSNHNDLNGLTAEQRWRRLQQTDSVLISEPFANRNGLQVGDAFDIASDAGSRKFQVIGVFTDYNAGKGFIVVSMQTYHRHWSDRKIANVGLTLADNVTAEQALRELRSITGEYPDRLLIRSDGEIRQMSLDIFDRTFAITHILRLLTVGVAFVGILSALMALSLERRAEFAVLRALGITPRELRNLLFLQTGMMGIIAGLLALPLGLMMSGILVAVINVRSFGWTMDFYVPPVVLLESVALAVVAALLAGYYPARRLAQLSPAEALRHE